MMNLSERIESISKWGEIIARIDKHDKQILLEKAYVKNRWFTPENSEQALSAILPWLKKDSLQSWIGKYKIPDQPDPKTVGIVMAGNIPLVGFHDFLCGLISGHKLKIKLSSQDEELLPFLGKLLITADARWKDYFTFEERLNGVDAVIATGSDNSARYFEYYFKNIPRIIRKNRTSIGVVMGEESKDEFAKLGQDVFNYFGMGCRNVSKIFVPNGFDLNQLKDSFSAHQEIVNHNKYANNYDYQKSIRLVSNKAFLDFGFLLLEESTELVSPISVLYYEFYQTQEELKKKLESIQEKTQCIVSARGWLKGSFAFGEAQCPALTDYADGVDTLEFLSKI